MLTQKKKETFYKPKTLKPPSTSTTLAIEFLSWFIKKKNLAEQDSLSDNKLKGKMWKTDKDLPTKYN